MVGINKVTILGRLGNDPEIRTIPNGDTVAHFSVATSEAWTDKITGERKESTEWHRIVFFRRQAEVVGQYLRKGSLVYIEGKIKTRKWQDQNGQERYTTEIIGDELQMLDGRQDRVSANNVASDTNAQSKAQAIPEPVGDFNDDICKQPF